MPGTVLSTILHILSHLIFMVTLCKVILYLQLTKLQHSDEHFTEGITKQTLTCFVIIRSCRTNCLLVSFKKHKVNAQ